MILSAAQSEFEALFSGAVVVPEDKDLLVTWSGGQRRPSDTSAALYATQDLAIEAWLVTARSFVPTPKTVLEWVLKPELHEFQITVADRRGMHRLVANRYAVKSQFKVRVDDSQDRTPAIARTAEPTGAGNV